MNSLASRIRKHDADVGVVGLGYVGLPLLVLFARAGFRATGFDIDPSKIRALRRRRTYLHGVTDADIRRARPRATSDFRELGRMDAVILCVPTPLTPDRRPDLQFIRSTARDVSKHHKAGALVVLESTTYPGTTREVVLPALQQSGRPFHLAYSPERVDPGNPRGTTEQTPKLVGGINPTSRDLATALYRTVIRRVIPVSSPEVAEAAKLLENIYRCVNIAMVNEMKIVLDRMGIDVWEVIAAASTKPYGFQPFYPGPGWGGHCIPLDPFYLSWRARQFQVPARFIELAGETNVQMPHYVVGKLEEGLARLGRTLRGARILVMGVAYKRDVDDMRESPAFEVMELLHERGAKYDYHDPWIPRIPRIRRRQFTGRRSVPLDKRTLSRYAAAVIVTDHSNVDYRKVLEALPLVVDTRNATAKCAGYESKVIKA